jgi:putative membrane-bound dehydrogenase-like protein
VIFRFLLLLAVAASAADFPQPYNSEKTPGEPMPAEEAAAKWKVPDGFKVSAWAAEPDVQNPIGCAWDARGRLWVAENYTYEAKRFDEKLRDRVLVFEGATTGHFTKRTVFTDDVQHLTSVEVGLGGVWLMAPPQVLFVPDKNGDDVPDGPAEVVLDGFTVPADNYHNFANGLRWGPDGWLYGRSGHSAPGRIGAPGTPEAERVPLEGTIWRYHPQRKVFEALGCGTTNPWGHDWNEAGDCFFVNTVGGHLWQLIPGAHYDQNGTLDPNPHAYETIGMIADHWHFDKAAGWKKSVGDQATNALGGGHAHCGAMIYLGDNWPDSYRGKLYTLNFHGRRMNVERLERAGSGYVGRHEGDAFFAADPWFRGLDLTYGPDGGVFVLDWSDTGECHESTGVHRTSGRIYKITYEGAGAVQGKTGVPPVTADGRPGRPAAPGNGRDARLPGQAGTPVFRDLTTLSNAELVKLHEHKNEWFVRMARRVLVERAAAGEAGDLVEKLRAQFAASSDAAGKVRALATLYAIGGMDAAFLESMFRDKDEAVRAWAVRILTDERLKDFVTDDRPSQPPAMSAFASALSNAEIIDRLANIATSDPSASVRLAVASALCRTKVTYRKAVAKELVKHAEDANDHNLPLMTWYASIPVPYGYADDLVEIARVCELPTTRRLITRRLSEDIEKQPQPITDLLALAVKKPAAYQTDILAGLAEGFTGWRKAPKPASWDAFVAAVPKDDAAMQARVRDLSALFGDGRALAEVKRIALDKAATLDARKAALRTLIDNRPDDLRAICEQLIGERFLNAVAVRGLALFDDPAIGKKLAQSYRAFHGSERKPVIDTLVSRPAFARALLEEIAAGKIPREEITAFHARQIRSFNDDALSKQLAEVWGEMHESSADKRALMAKLKTQLTPAVLASADKGAGRVVFESICATCHTLYGHGGQIGPDLTGSGRANLDYLLENIVDPGAVVNADYRLHILTLKDGRVLNGMVAAKTDRTLTLKTLTEPVTVERAEIVKQEEVAQSMMPEGLLLAFSETQVRDLIAYLMHPVQVALPEGSAPK